MEVEIELPTTNYLCRVEFQRNTITCNLGSCCKFRFLATMLVETFEASVLAVCFLLFRRTERHAAVAVRTVFLSVLVVSLFLGLHIFYNQFLQGSLDNYIINQSKSSADVRYSRSLSNGLVYSTGGNVSFWRVLSHCSFQDRFRLLAKLLRATYLSKYCRSLISVRQNYELPLFYSIIRGSITLQ